MSERRPQRTIGEPVSCTGIGLHSGEPVQPFYSSSAYDLYTGPADGRIRLPAFSQTDVRAGLVFDYDERVNWMLGVDIFNLFNDRVPTSMTAELPTLDATDPLSKETDYKKCAVKVIKA